MNSNGLTTQQYWEKYYQTASAERDVIESICSYYDRYWDLSIKSFKEAPKTIVEIGAYPGRYLAYAASKYNLHPTGIDFNSDSLKIQETMQAMGVQKYDYIQEDFFNYRPQKQFDIVFSNGFVEHFVNYNEVLDKHCLYLNNHGILFLLIPNKRYLRNIYGNLVDRKNQKSHNLKCMQLSVFKSFAERNNLQILHLDYLGGFPYRVHQPLNLFQRGIYEFVRGVSKMINPFLSQRPNALYSGTIVGVFKKH